MGWSFRKSISLGGLFRLNFSKGGIGASVGVRGARISIDPRGRTALNVGRGGLYARQSLGTVGSAGRRERPGKSNVSIAVAVAVILLVVVAFVIAWPTGKPAAKESVVKPVFVPMVAPPASPVRAIADPVKPPATTAPAPSDAVAAPPSTNTTATEWTLKEGGISGGAVTNLAPGQTPKGNVRVSGSSPTRAAMPGTGKVWVDGYTRDDGTVVKGHWRER